MTRTRHTRKTLPGLLAALAFFATHGARAQGRFEGVVELKMTMGGGGRTPSGEAPGGIVRMSISAIGARNDMDIQIPGLGANRMTTLTRFKNPNILYRINDQAKTYSEIDTGKATETVARQGAEDSYTVKKLGKETIQGYSCERILITSSRGTAETEMWMTKDLFFENSYRMLEGLGRGAPKSGIMKAMKDQNLEGFVVKMVTREKPGAPAAMTMELVKAERKSLPASLFEIPAGYIKDDSGMGMLPKDAQDRMKEMLKNLPPEQREMLEKKMREGNAK